MLGDDAELTAAVLAAQDGDEDAFRTVFRAVQPRLLGYIRTLVGEPDAEDVASESWLQIARDLDRFSGDADRFRGWAARIARNRALDHLRMRGRRPAVGGDESELSEKAAESDTADEAMESLATGRTLSLIARLPQDQAEAVVLRVVVGLDAKSAAQTLGKRPGAVRTAAHRGLKRLAELLRTDTDTDTDTDGTGISGTGTDSTGTDSTGTDSAGTASTDMDSTSTGGTGRGTDTGDDGASAGDPADPSTPRPGAAGRTAELGGVPAQRPARNGLVAPAGVTHSRPWTQKDM
ncbi:RNA polymerase sigma factor [Streptomyces sp. NPDC094045]|uniref:RNA polymerase sigma factor n=1 Tax=unclassified Streptomyces TaxID=2593676 RepID=UPI003393AAEC